MIKIEDVKKTLESIDMKKISIIFVLGIALIVLSFPTSKKSSTTKSTSSTAQTNTTDSYGKKQESKLKKALRKVEGVGKVEVMITMKASEESVVNKDSPYEESTNEKEKTIKENEETILIEEDGKKVPYVIKTEEPEVEGVIVVAQGGDNDIVKQNIVDAVSVLFHISSYKIKVLKMEDS
ncbi:MAG: stage III sporulation protein AG [Anaerostipes sp.]|jgi:stage III sporulation protein AG|nr:stage III sporulation protein AG [Anaerostipes sp.]MDD3747010.1 stage III sporulation protein AG [Anaerostipes sp.]